MVRRVKLFCTGNKAEKLTGTRKFDGYSETSLLPLACAVMCVDILVIVQTEFEPFLFLFVSEYFKFIINE